MEIKRTKMTDGSTMLQVETPFVPKLPERLKALGGRWSESRRAWYLPLDIEAEVRALCMEIFGIDPLGETGELVTLRWDVFEWSHTRATDSAEFWQFGRQILRRRGRDYAVMPGAGVSILGPGFASRGGSSKYPQIERAKEGTVLVIRDVPLALALKFVSENAGAVVERKEVADGV